MALLRRGKIDGARAIVPQGSCAPLGDSHDKARAAARAHDGHARSRQRDKQATGGDV